MDDAFHIRLKLASSPVDVESCLADLQASINLLRACIRDAKMVLKQALQELGVEALGSGWVEYPLIEYPRILQRQQQIASDTANIAGPTAGHSIAQHESGFVGSKDLRRLRNKLQANHLDLTKHRGQLVSLSLAVLAYLSSSTKGLGASRVEISLVESDDLVVQGLHHGPHGNKAVRGLSPCTIS